MVLIEKVLNLLYKVMVKGTMVTFSLDLTNQRLSAGDIR